MRLTVTLLANAYGVTREWQRAIYLHPFTGFAMSYPIGKHLKLPSLLGMGTRLGFKETSLLTVPL